MRLPFLAGVALLLPWAFYGAPNASKLAEECRGGNQKSCQKLAGLATNVKNFQRPEAIALLDDQALLAQIALHDPLAGARHAAQKDRVQENALTAVGKLDDSAALMQIVSSRASYELRRAAIRRVKDSAALLAYLGQPDMDLALSNDILAAVTDQVALAGFLLEHPNVSFRWSIFAKLNDQAALGELVKKSKVSGIRVLALQQLTDQTVLTPIATSDPDPAARHAAASRLTDQAVLAEIVFKDTIYSVQSAALGRLTDQAALLRIALGLGQDLLAEQAARKLTGQGDLAKVAQETKKAWVRRAAAEKLTDQAVLNRVAAADQDAGVRAAAAARINDPAMLLELVKTSQDSAVQTLAMEKSDHKLAAGWARTLPHEPGRVAAVAMIEDPAELADLALHSTTVNVAVAATRRIADQEMLARLATTAKEPQVSRAAIANLSDKELLSRIAQSNQADAARMGAIERLDDVEVLARLARDKSGPVRQAAAVRAAMVGGRTLADMAGDGEIEYRITGNSVQTIQISVRRLKAEPVRVIVAAGTYFVAGSAEYQNMIARTSVVTDLTTDQWTSIWISAACANRERKIPGNAQVFTVERPSLRPQLAAVAAQLDAVRAPYAVGQAAIWIVTDNANYSDLGILNRSGPTGISFGHVIEVADAVATMRICQRAGIDMLSRRIWRDLAMLARSMPADADPELRRWLFDQTGPIH